MKKIVLLVLLIVTLVTITTWSADVKMSELPVVTTLTDNDLFMLSYYSGGLYYSKKITVGNIKTVLSPVAGSSSIITVGTVVNGTWNSAVLPVEVDGHATGNLTAVQVSGTIIHNIGQSNTIANLTLPAAAQGYSFLLQVGETSTAGNYLRLVAASGSTMYVDGVASKDYASFDSPTIGDWLSCFTAKVGASTYNWFCTTGRGTVTTN
ncbi:MAG: hypothetical protein WC332_00055 [Clostridia bacterium]|jgi:hypothetical protein